MSTEKISLSGQEKIAAALGCILFFIPLIMWVKSSYVVGYMKHGFMINIIELTISLITLILFFLSWLGSLISFFLFLFSLFLAFQAYSGSNYTLPVLADNADKVIKRFGLESMFTPHN